MMNCIYSYKYDVFSNANASFLEIDMESYVSYIILSILYYTTITNFTPHLGYVGVLCFTHHFLDVIPHHNYRPSSSRNKETPFINVCQNPFLCLPSPLSYIKECKLRGDDQVRNLLTHTLINYTRVWFLHIADPVHSLHTYNIKMIYFCF